MVLHLLLAQRNLALSGSRNVLLKRLADHDRIEIPSATTFVDTTPTPQYSLNHFVHWLKTSHHCSVTLWPAKPNRGLLYQAHRRYQTVQLHLCSTWVTRRTSPNCCRPRKLQRCLLHHHWKFLACSKSLRTKYQRVSLSIFLYFSQVILTAPVLLPFAFLSRVIKVSRYPYLIFKISASAQKSTVSINGLLRSLFTHQSLLLNFLVRPRNCLPTSA